MYYVVHFKQGQSGSNIYINFYSVVFYKMGLSLSSDYLRWVRKIVFWPETVWRHFCSTTGQILIKDTQSVENGRPKDMRPQRIERFSALLYKRYGLLQGLLNNWKWKVQKIDIKMDRNYCQLALVTHRFRFILNTVPAPS